MVRKVNLGQDKIKLDLSREYGLVLEGGGAKGSFQIGAWRALREAGIKIKGVSGVSVGALNGALICMDDPEKAEDIWHNINYSAVMDFNMNTGSILETAEEIKKLIKDRGVDITPLKKLLHETVDEEKIRNSHCELFATTFSVSDMKLLNIDVKSASEGKMEEILLASAFFPVFKTEKLSGKLYTDGGGFNNVPLDVLVDRGYQDVIVVRIYGPGYDREKKVKIPEGTNIYHIAPREELGGVLEFDKKRSRKNMALGYLEASRLLYGLDGRRYYIYAPYEEPYYFDRMMSELELLKIYLESVLDEEALAYLDGYRFYTENVFPELARELKLKPDWDYKDMYLAILEELAVTFKISRYRVYKADELAREIHKSLLKADGRLPLAGEDPAGPAASSDHN
ncbi:patatin-like phospholipase family protein [[Clostridium] symbiosum]|uniref:Patatin-like phospholipase family protein n=1 Tax=Clostridium symbiosum TaxID=1512 RepID=A0AAW6APG4_CLOSY|nr:patatin-like phospholipase family protein [[Clostridium] symbiosum]KAA6141013.1 patatin-like phospholipase family protein [[Clostridium] symbiosum]MCR1941690.1 patatin-like phospholipase family protein [[Clostridium] symbiosum]MDB1976542.1 patatin-like phospholipase family protein [[Clostridium] symbiosum]MDB1981415.1 patatin-like phospholipase family protein [[Clostridium] symbiosum]MDB1985709.1 patatin-like phospholipase family protein [[Clostridium] symbiosum]